MSYSAELSLTLDGLIAVGVSQACALGADQAASAATDDPAVAAAKAAGLERLLAGIASLPQRTMVPGRLRGITWLQLGPSLPGALIDLATQIRPHSSDVETRAVLVELAVATEWPDGWAWTIDRDTAIAAAARLLSRFLVAADLEEMQERHRAATKRLGGDAIAGGLQANVNGQFLLRGGAGRAYWLAGQSAAAFIDELAKIDVLATMDPELTTAAVDALHVLQAELLSGPLAVADDLDFAERRRRQRNLAMSLRAVEIELLHLEGAETGRRFRRAARLS